jgi:Domain of Unknown Function with PDB structure (DUF3857)
MSHKTEISVLALILWSTSNLFSIGPGYEWEKDRTLYKLSEPEREMGELILKHHQQFDYVFEDKDLVMYQVYHRIIYVNNDEAVQRHNRISISMYNTIDLTDLKARAINKNGKVVNFDKADIKELKDEKSGNGLRIFAVDGIETGSEIEYFFIKKMKVAIYDRVTMQSDVKIKKATFRLTCPSHLKFDFKNYNGMSEVVRTETKDPKDPNVYSAEMIEIPSLKDENYSYFGANLGKIEFKLAYNTARSNARMYTWDEAGKTFYKVLYSSEKEDEKALDKYVKTLKDNPSADLSARIADIETKIKTEIKVDEDQRTPQMSEIASVIKLKVASTDGITRLFLAVYGKLGITCHAVITSDRKNTKFDGKFDSWSYLDNYVIYFPDTKGFIAPYKFETRYPLVPALWSANEGLFIEPINVGELKSALASIYKIPASEYTMSVDNMNIEFAFGDDLKNANVKLIREFAGHNASFLLPYHDFMTEEQKKAMVEEIVKQTAPDVKIKSWATKVVKTKEGDRFLIDLNFQSSHFLEKAGPKILFKAGLLIGPQVEMYRDENRTNPIENDFNRTYEREVKVIIPSGYTVKNPQDLKMKVLYEEGQNIPFSFESDYTIEGNVLKMSIKEYYKDIFAPLSRYEDFRKVINASADFNKVTLVLEKVK